MDVGADRLADPLPRVSSEDALDGRALVADQPILAQHDDPVGCVLDERSEALLLALHVDEQESLGRGLLLEAAVLTCEHPRCAAKSEPEEGDQQGRSHDRDDEHAGSRAVDPLFDEPGVLVQLVDADRVAVDGTPDRDVQLEEMTGHRGNPFDRLVGSVVPIARPALIGVARAALAGVGARDRGSDREAPAAELWGARIDDATVPRPHVDPADLA